MSKQKPAATVYYDLRSAREIMDEAVSRLHGDLYDCKSSLQVAVALTNFDRCYETVKDRLEGTPLSASIRQAKALYAALKPIVEEVAAPSAGGDGQG